MKHFVFVVLIKGPAGAWRLVEWFAIRSAAGHSIFHAKRKLVPGTQIRICLDLPLLGRVGSGECGCCEMIASNPQRNTMHPRCGQTTCLALFSWPVIVNNCACQRELTDKPLVYFLSSRLSSLVLSLCARNLNIRDFTIRTGRMMLPAQCTPTSIASCRPIAGGCPPSLSRPEKLTARGLLPRLASLRSKVVNMIIHKYSDNTCPSSTLACRQETVAWQNYQQVVQRRSRSGQPSWRKAQRGA
ncbi:hypothetical protein B0T24DRAFT_280319 [Lasiosphaeria ovina]|uniref:Uncharacterized protein n=1 Tax=Lasiosphaeria ovina TaxID=92902 RepID=A0AAE0KCG6_9PEZI|nr:hypothetical protein B0T24DRAFT_280319 [Lasiosphaeria ovina]